MKILNDFSTTVEKALTEIDPSWRRYNGLIVCGSHNPNNIESTILEIKKARDKKTPFLGICMGLQLGVIEFARNVLDIKDATSEELGEGSHVVKKMPELRVGLHPAMYNGKVYLENFWHNFKVDIDAFPQLWDYFEVGEANDVVSYMKLKDRENFIMTQFHPEYGSSKDAPHPILVDFINKCKGYEKVSGSSTPISDFFKKND